MLLLCASVGSFVACDAHHSEVCGLDAGTLLDATHKALAFEFESELFLFLAPKTDSEPALPDEGC